MYEELIEKLLEDKSWIAYGTTETEHKIAKHIQQAINAIEDLITALTASNEVIAKNKPKWIPVTERLPESGVHVLVCCRVKWLSGGVRSYVCDAFYSAPKTEICSYDYDIEAEYDEETDEYYLPEGWWEVIKNWDDYSSVAIEDFVSHWMPLPEPPEREDE